MSIVIDKAGGRIFLRSSWPTPGLSQVVPGARFSRGADDSDPHWSLPLSLTGCLALRERFGSELRVGMTLGDWARAERAREAGLAELSRAQDAPLLQVPGKAPRLAAAMSNRTYQRVGARFVAQGGNVILADQPGLGKTLELLGGIIEAGISGPYLVVCPKTAVESVWAREIPRWLGDDTIYFTVPEGREKRNAILNGLAAAGADTWVIMHPEMMETRVWWACNQCKVRTRQRAGKVKLTCGHDPKKYKIVREHEFPQLFGIEWGAIIADECDKSLIARRGIPTLVRTGMMLLRTRPDGIRLAASGTPFRSKPYLLWGLLNWLDPVVYPSFWNWVKAHWELGGYTGWTIERIKPEREPELWRSLSSRLLRRTKAEVAPDLPPKTYVGTPAVPSDPDSQVGVWLEMSSEQARAYREMLHDSVATLAGGELSAIGVLAELTRLKQFATSAGRMVRKDFRPAMPSNKLEYLVQLLEQLGYPDDPTTKVVVASQFTEILTLFKEQVEARLGGYAHTAFLTGEVIGTKRAAVIDSMNEPLGSGAHILFLNTKAGGVAITLDTADVMVIIDETWEPTDQEQLEDRIHRVSKPRPVQYYYLRSLDSVELGIAITNSQLADNAYRLLDGRRGVEYARAVLQQTRSLDGSGSSLAVGDKSSMLRSDELAPRSTEDTSAARQARQADGAGDRGKAARSKAQANPADALAATTTDLVGSENLPRDKKGKGKAMAKKAAVVEEVEEVEETDEELDYSDYKDKPATDLQARFAVWVKEQLGLEFSSKKEEAAFDEGIRLGTALRIQFQQSPENQADKAEKAEQRAAKKAAAAEAAPKGKKGKGKKAVAKTAVEPDDDDDGDDDGDDEEAAPPVEAKPGKAVKKAARSGAKAPF